MRITITYCAECAYADQAVGLTGKLLARYEDDIEELRIVPGHEGIFDVEIDGKMVFTRGSSGRFPDAEEIAKAIG